MALKLEGLRRNVSGLRQDIEDLNSAAIGAREQATTLKSHLGDIKSEIGAHVEDIEFTANVLGNSGGSEDQSIQTGGSGASTEPSQTSDAEKPHG